jgi:toxin ParE1/3/4
MRVRYSPRAFAERETIFEYIEERSPQGARNVKRAIVNAIRLLGSQPYMGQATDAAGALARRRVDRAVGTARMFQRPL